GAEIEIEPAVIVDVAPGGALAPVREMDPATRRRVAEAPALVVVERADAVAGEAEIGAAVVIVIAGAGTDPVARALEAGGAGRVAEASAPLRVEAALGSPRQQQVEPAVAIVVEEGPPRAIRVEQVARAARRRVRRVADTERACRIDERRRRRGRIPRRRRP